MTRSKNSCTIAQAEAARKIAYDLLSSTLDIARLERENILLSCYNRYGSAREEIPRELLDAARSGQELAREMVHAIAARLVARREPLPLALQEYLATAPAFRRPRGRPRGTDCFEGAAIADAVAMLVNLDLGFRRGRNRSPSGGARPTAFSIVAEALRQLGVRKSEEAVEKTWQKYRGLAPILFYDCYEPNLDDCVTAESYAGFVRCRRALEAILFTAGKADFISSLLPYENKSAN
jgi:hypothetical protein